TALDPARLERWKKALADDSLASPDHPFHVWIKSPTENAPRAGGDIVFHDFAERGLDGWFVTGEAFNSSVASAGDLVIGGSADRPSARVSSGGVDSGAVSNRLQGEARSPTFTINKKSTHLRLAGRN